MNKKLNKIIAILLVLIIAFTPMSAFAHSGGTDGAGGHKDNRNVSGLGGYHYHHGYGPHLHENGVCPYRSSSVVSTYVSKPTPTVNTKTATITSGTVKINGNVVNNANLEYPLISYNNITYFPMTYRNKKSLGLTSATEANIIYFTTSNKPSYSPDIAGDCVTGKKVSAIKLDYAIFIDGYNYDYDKNWPLLKYNDIVYVPLTYNLSNKLGLSTSWSNENGLSVNCKSNQQANATTPVSKPVATQEQKPTVQQQIQQVQTPNIQFKETNLNSIPAIYKHSTYYVYSLEKEPKFLGTISSNFNAPDSIFNPNGIYGSFSSAYSIRNINSPYGSYYSIYSAMSTQASYPPFIVNKDGYLCGVLTANRSLGSSGIPTYSYTELFAFFM